MRLTVILFLSFTLGPVARASGLNSRIGVAVQRSGSVCLSIRNPNLKPGDSVTLVVPDGPQSVIESAVIGKSDKGCPGVTEPAVPGYQLRIVTGTAPDSAPLVAVYGPASAFRSAGGQVTAQLTGKTKAQSFRTCTSAEGVHLTVWQAAPLKSKRLWHQYYYLGYDLEQSCTAKDTAQ